MDIRERLLRNEILHLAGDLRAVSQELITLQDFIRKEYGLKYIRFCDGQRADEVNSGQVQEFQQPTEMTFGTFGSGGSNIDESKSFKRRTRQSNTKSKSSTAVQSDDENSEDASDPPGAPVFNVWKTEPAEEDELGYNSDSFIPGSNGEDNNDNEDGQAPSRKIKLKNDSDFIVSDEMNEDGSLKRPRRSWDWISIKSFENLDIAKNYLKSDPEGPWTLRAIKVNVEEKKHTYDCKFGRDCSAKRFILVPSTTDTVELFSTNVPHDHPEPNIKDRGIRPEVKEKIKEYYNRGITRPRLILSALTKDGMEEPKRNQLTAFLSTFKIKQNRGQGVAHSLNDGRRKRGRPPKRPRELIPENVEILINNPPDWPLLTASTSVGLEGFSALL